MCVHSHICVGINNVGSWQRNTKHVVSFLCAACLASAYQVFPSIQSECSFFKARLELCFLEKADLEACASTACIHGSPPFCFAPLCLHTPHIVTLRGN